MRNIVEVVPILIVRQTYAYTIYPILSYET